jgi:UDPglucose 6-dehydrogenase
MNVTVIGTGYVGVTTCVTLAMQGHKVVGVDIDTRKVELLNRGVLPLYEEGMESHLKRLVSSEMLTFTTDVKKGVTAGDLIFLTVGTPTTQDGQVDLSMVEDVARKIGAWMDRYKLVVIKSTTPVGTAEKVKALLLDALAERQEALSFDVVSNPEFLREGKALLDGLNPERIVVGAETEKARELMRELYQHVPTNMLFTSLRDAEMIKYASNAFLATKISFVNELARLCERVGANILTVAEGMGMDSRIGDQFLRAGIGYGGSCFPKDVQGLLSMAKQAGMKLEILQAVQQINNTQVEWFLEQVQTVLPELSGKQVAMLGLTFKPETDDIREAPALKLIQMLLERGVSVKAYDPKGMESVRRYFPQISYAQDAYGALDGSDVVLLVTEWPEFIHLDWNRAKGLLARPLVFDGRNCLHARQLREWGYEYYGVGGERD